jgi:hypothetical protein
VYLMKLRDLCSLEGRYSVYNEPERESRADPDVTVDLTVRALMKVLAWVRPEIRRRALIRVDQQLKTGAFR